LRGRTQHALEHRNLVCCRFHSRARYGQRATAHLVEEFSAALIDRSKWTFDAGGSGFGNQELQFYTTRPENVHVESGHLVIEGRRETYHEKQFTSAR